MELQKTRQALENTKNLQNEQLRLSSEQALKLAEDERKRRKESEEEELQERFHSLRGRLGQQNLAIESMGSGNLSKFRPKKSQSENDSPLRS